MIKIKQVLYQYFDSALRRKVPVGKVLSGPFKGMKYSPSKSYYSSFWPKVMGCYESELHGVFSRISNRQYNVIWDIGCAEGYYAVGLAQKFPTARIVAYDISETARDLCRKLSEANGVEGRVVLHEHCSNESFRELLNSERCLIVCDCEGYEANIFVLEAAVNLKKADLIIELHEKIKNGVTAQLTELFSQSHDVLVIETRSELYKILSPGEDVLAELNLMERRYAIAERRYGKMAWLIAYSKQLEDFR